MYKVERLKSVSGRVVSNLNDEASKCRSRRLNDALDFAIDFHFPNHRVGHSELAFGACGMLQNDELFEDIHRER